MARLKPGQTVQPTALVHEAYLRLVRNQDPGWDGRRHFYGAAARAMREILIEQASHKSSQKHGGQAHRLDLAEGIAWIESPAIDLLAPDEAIEALRAEDAHLAEIVELRYYAGLSVEAAARVIGVSDSTLKRDWRYARAWLARRLAEATA
jgi:RNA polymerase sigma factor (TIGR02999 family)